MPQKWGFIFQILKKQFFENGCFVFEMEDINQKMFWDAKTTISQTKIRTWLLLLKQMVDTMAKEVKKSLTEINYKSEEIF